MSSSHVGIGTSTPQKKLDIAGGDIRLDNSKSIFFATTDGNIGRVSITGDESSDFIQLKVDNSNNHILKLNTTGVGIGTTSPGEKLEVVGNISASAVIEANQFKLNRTGYDHFRLRQSSGTGLEFYNSTDDNVTLKLDSGKVGIGTTSPGEKLEVVGNISASGTGSFRHGVFNLPSAAANEKILQVQKAGSNVFFVDEDGDGVFSGVVEFKNFAYGSTSDTFIGGREDLVLGMNWNNDTAGTSIKFTTNEFTNSPSNTLMTISSSGDVGIGTTTPSEKLEVAGKAIIRRTGTATAHSDTDLLVTDATAGSSTAAIQILGGNAGFSNLQFSDTDSYNQGGIIYSHSTDRNNFTT